MKRPWSTGVVLAALTCSLVISADAVALENPEILPTPTGASPLLFESKGGESKLTTSIAALVSKKFTGKGEFNSARLGKTSVFFLEVSSAGVACTSVGDLKGNALVVNADAHLVDILPAGVLSLGLAVTPSTNVLIKCGTLAAEVKGTVIGQVDSVTSGASIPAGTAKELLYHVAGGKQEFRTCDLDMAFCSGKTLVLLAEFGTGFLEAQFESEGEIVFSLTTSIDF